MRFSTLRPVLLLQSADPLVSVVQYSCVALLGQWCVPGQVFTAGVVVAAEIQTLVVRSAIRTPVRSFSGFSRGNLTLKTRHDVRVWENHSTDPSAFGPIQGQD